VMEEVGRCVEHKKEKLNGMVLGILVALGSL